MAFFCVFSLIGEDMPTNNSSFLDKLTNIVSPPFSLDQVEGFPHEEFTRLQGKYTECEEWYTGQALDSQTQRKGKPVDIYPVKINPLKSAVQKHMFALFGEVEEDDGPMVSPKVIFTSDAEQALAEKAENVLTQIWWESHGRAIQLQNAGLSQVYGGCVFELSYEPFDKFRSIPMRIDTPHPRYFVGIPASSDMFRLKEAWIVKPISQDEAREHGYTNFKSESDVPWLIKHWTDTKYEAWINDQPMLRKAVDEKGNESWFDPSGENPFGVVPVVYIPHIRIDGFYGENMFDHVKGNIKELNLRVADFGDAVNADAHAYAAMRNVQGSPDLITPAPNLNVLNLGNSMGLPGGESTPDLWDLSKDRASVSMSTLVTFLYDQLRRDLFVPKVADGEDEGSQRSGLTLAMRMLSLLWHAQCERVFWTTGLNMLNRMILHILAVKKQAGITQAHSSLRIKQDWSPVLPRDREMLINEVVARVGAIITSPEKAFEILGDVPDPEEEIKRILEFRKELAKAMTVEQPEATKKVAPGTPTAGTSSSSSE